MHVCWVCTVVNSKLKFNYDKNVGVEKIVNYSKTKNNHNIESSTQANNL